MDDITERKKLIEYLPPFMQQFPEIKQIMQSENEEIIRLSKNMQSILDNGFIEDCNEYGIKKYENILGIVPAADDTLKSRKIRVLNRWNDTLPYTYRILIRRLNLLCGVNYYDICGNLENYELFIATDLPEQGQVNELDVMLDKILPMNMYIVSNNKISHKVDAVNYVGGNVTNTRVRIIGKEQ